MLFIFSCLECQIICLKSEADKWFIILEYPGVFSNYIKWVKWSNTPNRIQQTRIFLQVLRDPGLITQDGTVAQGQLCPPSKQQVILNPTTLQRYSSNTSSCLLKSCTQHSDPLRSTPLYMKRWWLLSFFFWFCKKGLSMWKKGI